MTIFMKKATLIITLALLSNAIAGCSSHYVIQKKNGEMIITKGKPEIDDDTGLVTYRDAEGNEYALNRNEIVQMIKK